MHAVKSLHDLLLLLHAFTAAKDNMGYD